MATDTNNAMYKYDGIMQHRGMDTPPIPTCDGGTWMSGTKVLLSEKVFKYAGRSNVAFSGITGYRSFTPHGCTSCKCTAGCSMSVTVTNDGKAFSGAGSNGDTWNGHTAPFTVKDITPTVYYITTGIPGYRDSTRVSGPTTGGTVITIVGKDFQNSPRLRCRFSLPEAYTTRAGWINSSAITCITPPYFTHLSEYGGALGMGVHKVPYVKVQVTNNGGPGDGGEAMSANPHLEDDGSYSYLRMSTNNAWTKQEHCGFPQCGNPFRSTCYGGLFPNYGLSPCRGAHVPGESRGNDVVFHYAACYDNGSPSEIFAQHVGSTQYQQLVTQSVALGQKFSITASDPLTSISPGVEGYISYIRFYMGKATDAEQVVRVTISGTDYAAQNGTVLLSTDLTLRQTITNNDLVDVFFEKQIYLKSGIDYYVEIRWLSGAEDLAWANMIGGSDAANTLTGVGLTDKKMKLLLYGCSGCRLAYTFNPVAPQTTTLIGESLGKSLQRSMLAQAFTTEVEVTTLTRFYLKLSTQGSQTRVMVWLTQYGKYGENVCTSVGTESTRLSHCDADGDGVFNDPCVLGAACNQLFVPNGGCGGDTRSRPGSQEAWNPAAGICGPAPVLTNGHLLAESPDHSKLLSSVDGWAEFEFAIPVTLERYTTYYITAGVVGSTETSNAANWYSGNRLPLSNTPPYGPNDPDHTAATTLGPAYARNAGTWVWSKVPDCYGGDNAAAGACVLAVKFLRCPTVAQIPSILNISTTTINNKNGYQTGCCDFRVSPRGGQNAVTFKITGRHILPSEKLACVFLDESDAATKTVPGTIVSQSGDIVTMECTTPEYDPHNTLTDVDRCLDATQCTGVKVLITNDGIHFPAQVHGPKWDVHGVPIWTSTHSPFKILFSDLYVDGSAAGSDNSGDGSRSRPFKSIQRALDAANPVDHINVLPGTYVCSGDGSISQHANGLRSHGKKVNIQVMFQGQTQATDTFIDCGKGRMDPNLQFNNVLYFSGYAATNPPST